jgi:hypothetical protein
MQKSIGIHWKGSQTAEWAEKASQSYERISRRAKEKKPVKASQA